ncbi:hypothetical protein [Halarchaeum grantii]|uniref:hypothetical protein n=1 Tax=Halarchaeum grantii TaxID=1193105 RepID=UPI001663EFAE|nr:hypothetical protein [Halarchaeum grantii]
MPSSRRRYLAAAGASALAGLAGCSGPDTTSTSPTEGEPATDTSSTTGTSGTAPSTDAARFEANLVRDLTDDHPPRFSATLTNVSDEPFTLTCGFAPPLSVTMMRAAKGDAELFCYPVDGDARQHVHGVETDRTNASTTSLPPENRIDGCWRVTGSFAVNAIAFTRTLAPGESANVAYDAYTLGRDACFPDGDYRATTEASASAGETAGASSATWTYGVTLSLRDGSVSGVTASDVTAVTLT